VKRARVVQCQRASDVHVPFGETVSVTGTLRRWWWFVEPGYGATPDVDRPLYGAVLLVDGSPVPLFGQKDDASREQTRRLGAACDGQTVTVTARWEPAANPRSASRYTLVNATFDGPCAEPRRDRPEALGAGGGGEADAGRVGGGAVTGSGPCGRGGPSEVVLAQRANTTSAASPAAGRSASPAIPTGRRRSLRGGACRRGPAPSSTEPRVAELLGFPLPAVVGRRQAEPPACPTAGG
jgi:hypothetical protein